jgi:hypothetical protein
MKYYFSVQGDVLSYYTIRIELYREDLVKKTEKVFYSYLKEGQPLQVYNGEIREIKYF